MENNRLDHEQSLALITEMIQNTRNRMERHAGRPLLIWGYVTIAVTLAVWIALRLTHEPAWNTLWASIPLLGSLLMRLTRREEAATAVTHIDRIIGQIWLVLGATAFSLGLLAMFCFRLPILFLVILLMGIGTTLTGLVTRYRWGVAGGIAGILLSVAALAAGQADPGLQYLVFAAAFLVMMVVPGHLLNHRSKNHV